MSQLPSQKPDRRTVEGHLERLEESLAGECYTDIATRQIYSTDASIYQQLPRAVAVPKDDRDIQKLIRFAIENQIGLIPRTAGTSLAGQVVGDGIVVDVSKHFSEIIEVNDSASWVRVQPGVIRDELNIRLAKHGLYFAPETSTSNRAMIGGMLGNNSCGANSIVYGSVREHVIAVSGFLSDGSRATFGPLTKSELISKCDPENQSLEASIYRAIVHDLSSGQVCDAIRNQFPKPSIKRRNTGYAIDTLVESEPFGGVEPLNLAKLVAGSEGTLFFATEVKLKCVPLPSGKSTLACVHFKNIHNALLATQISMRHGPSRCELIDEYVIQGARSNVQGLDKLEFMVGTPAAILLIEFKHDSLETCARQAEGLIVELKREKLGFAYPVLQNEAIDKTWAVRKSGMGFINNRPGSVKPVTVIEDSAVDLSDLPAFVAEVDDLLLSRFGLKCVHYGHAGAGELHLRPNLDISQKDNRSVLRSISTSIAEVVKKYRGSLSGEHGDGRLRSEHIRYMVGDECYTLLEKIKTTWDPNNIFNPGKIVQSIKMDSGLRHFKATPIQPQPVFRFADAKNLLGAASMCSGSGDCRKTHLTGGTMCPSYMATRNEYDSTRARANLLYQMLSQSPANQLFENKSDADEVKRILDLCLSCKGCKSECPSNVDLAKIKAEFMQGYYDSQGVPLKTKAIASFGQWCRRASLLAGPINFLNSNRWTSGLIKKALGIHRNRSLPKLASTTLRKWFANRKPLASNASNGPVILFCDEFTNFIDVEVGKATVELLEILGYQVNMVDHVESGRSAISLGMLHVAKRLAEQNVSALTGVVSERCPLIGIEPSVILTIRDEYPDLVSESVAGDARSLANQSRTIDELLASEIDAGRITSENFDNRGCHVMLHGHCHQKALSSMDHTRKALELPKNNDVQLIDSGCCGMAGFFGYEADKFDLSMQIGELALFPAIRNAPTKTMIAATGISCRHQILDGTSRQAFHPVQILRDRVKIDTVQ